MLVEMVTIWKPRFSFAIQSSAPSPRAAAKKLHREWIVHDPAITIHLSPRIEPRKHGYYASQNYFCHPGIDCKEIQAAYVAVAFFSAMVCSGNIAKPRDYAGLAALWSACGDQISVTFVANAGGNAYSSRNNFAGFQSGFQSPAWR